MTLRRRRLRATSGSVPVVVDQVFGVNTHMAFNVGDMTALASTVEAEGMRDQFLWPTFEWNSPGERYRWSMNGDIIKFMDGTTPAGTSCMVFGYGNDLWGSSRPLTAPNIAAYAAAAAWLVDPVQGGDKLKYIQLWNEWNLEGGSPASGPGGTNAAYEALFNAASAAMQAAGFPKSKIVTTGLARTGTKAAYLTLMDDFITNTTILANAGALGLHLYNYADAATAADLLDTLDTVHGYVTAKTGNPDFPIVITEWGWTLSTTGSFIAPYNATQVSTWIGEFITGIRARPWVHAAYLYQLRDEVSDGTEFNAFGLLEADDDERATAAAFRAAIV